ncbi:MAG: hypothetical protein JNJ99_15310, partial [Crocinitomicaceae bacterium]|nr:hypothetical protein [Crocinitomicaceae bacterium]
MIKHIFTIAILQFCFIAKSQEVNFTYGSPITKESISGMEYTDWFYNPAIVGGSQTKVNFLGYFNKHYFIVKNIEDKGHVLLAFAENLKLANAWPLQKFSSVEGISYLDAVVFQNELVFFFNGNSDLVAKGNAGLFMAKFDYNSMKFNNPELVDQFGGAGKVKDLECTISENGQFIALVVNPDANGVNYSYGFVTLDNKLTKIKTESEVTGKFTENHHYHSAFISNKGGLYLLFDDNGESPFGSTGSASTQKPHAHATLIQHNSDGSKSEKFIQLDGRLLLRLKCVDRENGVEVFISWFNEEDENKTGFSFYSPEQGKETFKYEFDQNWVEPYVKRTLAFTLEDLAVKKNQASSTIVNVFFDLKNTIETETDVIYIIKKKTNIAIPGGTTSTPGGTYVNNGSHA